MKVINFCIWLWAGVLCSGTVAAKSPAAEDSVFYRDFEYLYDTKAVFNCTLTGVKTAGGYTIFADLTVAGGKKDIALYFSERRFRFFAGVYPDYLSKKLLYFDSIPSTGAFVDNRALSMRFSFTVPAMKVPDMVAFLAVYDIENELVNTYDLPLKLNNREVLPGYLITPPGDSLPFRQLKVGEPAMIRGPKDVKEYTVYVYGSKFTHAPAPFALQSPPVPPLQYDTFFQCAASASFVPDREGFYFIQHDTSSTTEGLSIFASHARYPEPARIEDLTGPLRYLTKNEEFTSITTSPDVKTAFDRVWLQFAGNQNEGRKLIKEYYSRVELANRMFTEYKEGYKSDRGMVFIVMGRPDTVFKTPDKEIWIYKLKNKETLEWVFMKTPTLLAPGKYTLIRDAKFETHWRKATDEWRTGKIILNK